MIKRLFIVLILIFSAKMAIAQGGYERVVFDKVNLTRSQLGVPTFVWDERLARVAREAVANNWAYHEGFASRIARQGFDPDYSNRYIAEGSFPSEYGLEGILNMMKTTMRNSRHGRDFGNPLYRLFGCAYGGRGDKGEAFYIFVYLKP